MEIARVDVSHGHNSERQASLERWEFLYDLSSYHISQKHQQQKQVKLLYFSA
jgi:hypothetical protein